MKGNSVSRTSAHWSRLHRLFAEAAWTHRPQTSAPRLHQGLILKVSLRRVPVMSFHPRSLPCIIFFR